MHSYCDHTYTDPQGIDTASSFTHNQCASDLQNGRRLAEFANCAAVSTYASTAGTGWLDKILVNIMRRRRRRERRSWVRPWACKLRPIFLICGMVQGLHVDWFLQVAVGAIYIYTRCANAVNELQTYWERCGSAVKATWTRWERTNLSGSALGTHWEHTDDQIGNTYVVCQERVKSVL